METLYVKFKRYLVESKEDFLYLLIAGAPFGILHALISRWFAFGEMF